MSHLVMLLRLFIAIRQSVDVWVVKQRVVPISPRELLGAHAEVRVGSKLRPLVFSFLRLLQSGVDIAHAHTR